MKKKYIRGRTIEQHIKTQMKSPSFKKAWHDLDTEFELIEDMIKARKKAGLSQTGLAKKIGTKQPAIARWERGGFKKATVETLQKIASALNKKLVVRLQAKNR